MGTMFTSVYDRFLGKITDDMYMELTPEDTIRDLQILIVDAIPGFEFPRKNLSNYSIETVTVDKKDLKEDDFVINDLLDDESSVLVDRSSLELN